jgi:hypothetical protein
MFFFVANYLLFYRFTGENKNNFLDYEYYHVHKNAITLITIKL